MQLSEKLEGKITRILEGFDSTMPEFIVYEIFQAAAEHWLGSDEDDFCLQSSGGESLIFGGTNRLRWTARHGFVPDASYCTAGFIERCRQLREKYRP